MRRLPGLIAARSPNAARPAAWRYYPRAVLAALLAPLVAALVAACGSASPGAAGGTPPASTQPASTQPASTQSARAAAGCATTGLRITLGVHAQAAAAGTEYIPIDVTNASGRRCVLRGYPDVAFVTGISGRLIGRPAAADRAVAVRRVALAPGRTAHAWLLVGSAGNYPARDCHPVTAHWLRVRIAGQGGSTYIPHAFPACAAKARAMRVLIVEPLQPGRGRRGTAG